MILKPFCAKAAAAVLSAAAFLCAACSQPSSAEEAIKAAVKDYYDKNGISYDPAMFPKNEDCEHCAYTADRKA